MRFPWLDGTLSSIDLLRSCWTYVPRFTLSLRAFIEYARKLDILEILPLFLPGLRKLDAELRCMYSGFVRCLKLKILLIMRRLSSDSPICSVSMFHLNFGRYFMVQTSSLQREPFFPPIG